MNESGKAELFKFINNEIDLGFTLVETAKLAHSREHQTQALSTAREAYETAARFMDRVAPGETDPSWERRLAALRTAIDSTGSGSRR